MPEPADQTPRGVTLVTGAASGIGRATALAGLFCDAGFGKDGNSIRRVQRLDQFGRPGASVSVTSARIGNGRSVLQDGILSFVNQTAAGHGARIGMTAGAYVALMQKALAK
jgi:NAD(P)-dependent dehydrogenase (short-subunit alcohol dehydrogenase family)